jgi:hypothetical protein
MKRAWTTLLRLYPKPCRDSFAAEMEAVFDQAAEERRRHGRLAYAGFLIAELLGAASGAAMAWMAQARRGPFLLGLPDEPAGTQAHIEANLRRMEHAIATHQFEKARFYSHYDLLLRERLKHQSE